jgi:signal transduction histidine kinase/ActR/RegA family two-component response regulator
VLVDTKRVRLRHVLARQGWRAYLALGAIATAVYFALPSGSDVQTNLYRAVAFSAAAAVLLGAKLHRPPSRAASSLLAAGLLLFALGDVAWSVWPGLADPAYLAAYPLLIVAVGWLVHQHGRLRVGDVLDSAIVCTGAALVLWIVLIDRAVRQSGESWRERVITGGYPIMDLLLFAAIVYFVGSGIRLNRTYQMLGLGFALLLASDVVFGRMELSGTYYDGIWLDAGWLCSYVVVGAAGLHPAAGQPLTRRTSGLRTRPPWLRISLLAAASLVAPAALVGQAATGTIEVDAIVTCAIVMTVLTFARLGLLLGEHFAAVEAQRATEDRLRLALQWTGTTYWEWDPASDDFSAVARDFEVLPAIATGGVARWIEERVVPADRSVVAVALRTAAEQGVDFGIEYRVRGADDVIRWIETQAYVVPGGGGRRLVGLTRDVSARKRLEEQFHQSQKMEAVGQLAGGVAHDFNNLLTAILGYCTLARESPQGDEDSRRVKLDRAIEAARRAATLTQQLLAYSRRQRLDPKVIELEVVLRDTRDLLSRLIGEHIEVVVASGAGVGRVRADAGQLTQVLVNLAVNARDAMPGGGTLTIDADDVELAVAADGVEAGSYVRLTVRDTGHGMDEETSRRAFEPFFTTKAVGEGTGLGLAMVYGIVTQSGGHVTVESAPGAGATFAVYLPRTTEPAVVLPPVAEAPPDGGSERVLVVEDEQVVRELVAEALADDGYDVTAVSSATEALPLATQQQFDLVISDLVMPQMSGEQLAVALAMLTPPPRVILMSGYAYDALSPHAAEVPFLTKPFALGELRALVRATLDARQPTPEVAAR